MKFLNRSIYYIYRAFRTWRQGGLNEVLEKFLNKIRAVVKEIEIKERLLNANDLLPQVSIIIPVFNALSMTQDCLTSIYLETKDVEFEVLIIDNASSDDTIKWLEDKQKEYQNLRVIRLDHNIGFGPAVNVGIRYSQGEFIVVLNNDTLVSPGWLRILLGVIKSDPTVGIVSPVTNYVGEGHQIDFGASNVQPNPLEITQYAKSIVGRNEIFYEPNRLVFFCVLFRRELVDFIGDLDEGYEKGNFEDDDYCLRTKMAGYKLAIAKNSFVYHHGTATFKINRISHSNWMEINRHRFYSKVGRMATTLSPQVRVYSKREVPISVIVRTKNRPSLLEKALTSLANQTYRDFEVVIVNDGGEDVSSLFAQFEISFHITYIHHDISKGRTVAINEGIKHANGKWIAYLDDDDILYPWHFEALMQSAENSGAKVVYSDHNKALFLRTKTITPDVLQGGKQWEYNRRELLVQNFIPIHSWIHLRECIDRVGYWNDSLDRLEDYEFLLRLSALYDFKHVSKTTCEYRYYLDTGNSISTGRKEYLSGLQHIYDAHPTDDKSLLKERQLVLEEIHVQVQKIDELMRSSGESTEDGLVVNRAIIRLVTGM